MRLDELERDHERLKREVGEIQQRLDQAIIALSILTRNQKGISDAMSRLTDTVGRHDVSINGPRRKGEHAL